MAHLKRLISGAVLTVAAASQPAVAVEDTVLVEVDQARIVRLEQPVSTVIVGNPSIADALVQNREMLVITGKSYGVTNLIVLDDAGETIGDLTLHVRSDEDGIVTVQRGHSRQSYSCAPTCERTLALGDTVENFENLTAQIESRLGLATSQSGGN